MDQNRIIHFFDKQASTWDEKMVTNGDIINRILDYARVDSGNTVLDVGCGTGVMIPYYLERGVESVVAIDISPEMVKIAREKFPQENIQILCGNIETCTFGPVFDRVVVYNALPHFEQPQTLVKILRSFLKPGGTLTIAHGISREKLQQQRLGRAKDVTVDLISADDLAKMFEPELQVVTKISDQRMYQVTGLNKNI